MAVLLHRRMIPYYRYQYDRFVVKPPALDTEAIALHSPQIVGWRRKLL
jgi:hypothetical protein